MKDETVIMILESLMSECNRRFSDSEKLLKIRNWTIKLADLTDEQGMEGLNKALDMTNDFMISVGKFKDLCITQPGCESIEDEGNLAWSQVMKYLNSYTCPVFKDSSIPEAIRKMGGWSQLCLMLTTEEPFRKKEFIRLYSIMRRKNEEFNPMLIGSFRDNHCFIGYDKTDNLDEVLLKIENKRDSDCKLLNMINNHGTN